MIYNILKIIVRPQERAIFLYRCCHLLNKYKLKPLVWLFSNLNVILNSCEISPSAQIGPGFKVCHSIGVVIGRTVIAGENLALHQNVTLGVRGEDRNPLIIGDNVYIAAGAVVIGSIRIGNNVNIGANAVVTKNVPDNCTVVGVPAYIIKENGVKVNKQL